MSNLLSWFEIPATDINRAAAFYGNLFDNRLEIQDFGGFKICTFPGGSNGVNGAIVQHDAYMPSHQGVLIYLNGGDDLSEMLKKAEDSGAKILRAKTMISPDQGYMALFEDSEGNRIGIRSKN